MSDKKAERVFLDNLEEIIGVDTSSADDFFKAASKKSDGDDNNKDDKKHLFKEDVDQKTKEEPKGKKKPSKKVETEASESSDIKDESDYDSEKVSSYISDYPMTEIINNSIFKQGVADVLTEKSAEWENPMSVITAGVLLSKVKGKK